MGDAIYTDMRIPMFQSLIIKSRHLTLLCVLVAFVAGGAGWFFVSAEKKVVGLFIAACLSWLTFVDIERKILPNVLTYGLIAGGLIWTFIFRPDALVHHISGAMGGFALFWLISFYYLKRRKKVGLGLGDAKLFAAAGAWLGWYALPSVMLISATTGLFYAVVRALVEKRWSPDMRIAFGPFLAVGFWIVWLLGPIQNNPF